MSDLISRQAAIDANGLDEEIRCEMCRNPMHTDRGCDGCCAYDENLYKRIMQILDKRIKPLPSAQPLTAYVISDEDGNIKCSNCGGLECWGNYCMNCGAKMRGEQDE